jgi:hypothetical protein
MGEEVVRTFARSQTFSVSLDLTVHFDRNALWHSAVHHAGYRDRENGTRRDRLEHRPRGSVQAISRALAEKKIGFINQDAILIDEFRVDFFLGGILHRSIGEGGRVLRLSERRAGWVNCFCR